MTRPRADTKLTLWGKEAKGETLSWDWARERLEAAQDYWLTTVSAQGRPASRPVWGAWLDDSLLLSVGSVTVWRNFRGGPEASVNLPDSRDVVIVEGTLRLVDSDIVKAQFIEIYNPKYSWNFTLDTVGSVFVLDPRVVLAWTAGATDVDTQDAFPKAAGRWEWETI
jgi:hypothetical protein